MLGYILKTEDIKFGQGAGDKASSGIPQLVCL